MPRPPNLLRRGAEDGIGTVVAVRTRTRKLPQSEGGGVETRQVATLMRTRRDGGILTPNVMLNIQHGNRGSLFNKLKAELMDRVHVEMRSVIPKFTSIPMSYEVGEPRSFLMHGCFEGRAGVRDRTLPWQLFTVSLTGTVREWGQDMALWDAETGQRTSWPEDIQSVHHSGTHITECTTLGLVTLDSDAYVVARRHHRRTDSYRSWLYRLRRIKVTNMVVFGRDSVACVQTNGEVMLVMILSDGFNLGIPHLPGTMTCFTNQLSDVKAFVPCRIIEHVLVVDHEGRLSMEPIEHDSEYLSSRAVRAATGVRASKLARMRVSTVVWANYDETQVMIYMLAEGEMWTYRTYRHSDELSRMSTTDLAWNGEVQGLYAFHQLELAIAIGRDGKWKLFPIRNLHNSTYQNTFNFNSKPYDAVRYAFDMSVKDLTDALHSCLKMHVTAPALAEVHVCTWAELGTPPRSPRPTSYGGIGLWTSKSVCFMGSSTVFGGLYAPLLVRDSGVLAALNWAVACTVLAIVNKREHLDRPFYNCMTDNIVVGRVESVLEGESRVEPGLYVGSLTYNGLPATHYQRMSFLDIPEVRTELDKLGLCADLELEATSQLRCTNAECNCC